MENNTKLLIKMIKAMNFCEAYVEDFELDKKWLSDKNSGYTDFLWVVKKTGTEIMPLHLAFAKGCYNNIKANMLAERDVRAYLIKIKTRENGTFDGAMTGVKNLSKFLLDNEKTPSAITMKFILSDGKEEELTIDWQPHYFDVFMSQIEFDRDDIKTNYVSEVLY